MLRIFFKRLFRIFDDLRYKRNSLLYYGKEMNFNTGKETIKNSIKFIEELRKFIETT